MFEEVPPEPEVLRGADDDAVVAAIEEWNRLESAVSARRLDAIAELTSRRCDKEGERAQWRDGSFLGALWRPGTVSR
jgi:hypothetical protein